MKQNILMVLTILMLIGQMFVRNGFASDRDVEIWAALGQKYDDNVTYAESDEDSDFISTATVGVNLDWTGSRTNINLGTKIVQEQYWDLTDNNNNSQYM